MPSRDKTPVGIIGIENLTPDLRRKVKGISGSTTYSDYISENEKASTSTIPDEIETEIDKRLLAHYRPQIIHKLVAEIQTLREQVYFEQRCSKIYCSSTTGNYNRSTWITIPYNTIRIDGNRYKISNYRYYAIKAGTYSVTAAFSLQSTGVGTSPIFQDARIALFKGQNSLMTSVIHDVLDYQCTETTRLFLNGTTGIYLNPGEFIEIKFFHTHPTTDLTSTYVLNQYGYLYVHWAGSNCQDLTAVTIPTF